MNIWVLIYRSAWTVLGVILLLALGYAFYPPIRQFHEMQKKESNLQDEIRFEEEMLRHLQQKKERLLNDPRFVERIAREELGLARPGETVFKFVDPAGATTSAPPRMSSSRL